MMLCKADFEEIFPELFSPNQRALAEATVAVNNPACIARWEDEGGSLSANMRRRDWSGSSAAVGGQVVPELINASFALATLPVVAAYAAAQTMLSGFDQMAKH